MQQSAAHNICICYPNKNAVSETFIKGQINYIKPSLELYEGWLPSQISPKGNIFPFPLNILLFRGTLRNVFPSVYNQIYDYFLLKILKKKAIKAVLGNYGPMGIRIAEVCKKNGIDFFVHFYGFDAYAYKTLDTFKKSYVKIFQNSTGIICVSLDMQKQLVALGADEKHIHLIPSGVDTNLFNGAQPSLSNPVFLFVGRFVEKKSPLELIQAFKLCVETHASAKLILVGTGPLWDQCKEEVKKLKLEDSITFTGNQSPAEIKQLMLHARAYVQHSVTAISGDSEGTPVIILEASSCGLPVISTKHAGIKEAVIHNQTGYLVEEHDIVSMSKFMNDLIDNPQLAGELGAAGRKHILQNYETEKQKKKLLDVILAITK